MPIKPENKHRYPKSWKDIRAEILARANNRCEFCGVQNYSWVQRHGKGIEYDKDWAYCLSDEDGAVRIILTIAHLDHTPENCAPDNLRALCQLCHNRYDMPHRQKNRRGSQHQGMLIFNHQEATQ